VDVATRGLEGEDAPRPERDGRPPARILRAVGDERDVGAEQIAVLFGEAAEEGAAELLLAVEDELDITRPSRGRQGGAAGHAGHAAFLGAAGRHPL
jgi:hypothetical protein